MPHQSISFDVWFICRVAAAKAVVQESVGIEGSIGTNCDESYLVGPIVFHLDPCATLKPYGADFVTKT